MNRATQRRPDLERVRSWRVKERAAAPIADEMKSLGRQLERTGKRLCEFISLWEEIIPSDLHTRTRVRGMRGGVYHIAIESSPVLFEIDRILREGGLATMRSRMTTTLVQIKLAIGSLEE